MKNGGNNLVYKIEACGEIEGELFRICPKCKQKKLIKSEFGYINKENGEIGNQSWCKKCRSGKAGWIDI